MGLWGEGAEPLLPFAALSLSPLLNSAAGKREDELERVCPAPGLQSCAKAENQPVCTDMQVSSEFSQSS